MIDFMGERRTVDYMLSTKCSISRFGDGELRLIHGGSAPGQRELKKEIGFHLHTILDRPVKGHLSCIPLLNAGMSDKKYKFWKSYGPYTEAYLKSDSIFGSAFIGRTDSAPHIDDSEYWESCRRLFKGDHVLILCGKDKGVFPDKSLFRYALSHRVLCGPPKNAYKSLNALLSVLLKQKKVDVFVLSLGPTATVLAYELSRYGFRALDLGRLGCYYADRSQP